jgi:toxin-antitoxin system PIN domain toxin
LIAVDTNILVYAHRLDSEWHRASLDAVRELTDRSARWGIPWPCIHEFLAIVTHPRIYSPPTPLAVAVRAITVWIESPGCVALAEGPGYLDTLRQVLEDARSVGGMVHDAHVAAICLYNGASVLWTADRDFSRYPRLTTLNPLARR